MRRKLRRRGKSMATGTNDDSGKVEVSAKGLSNVCDQVNALSLDCADANGSKANDTDSKSQSISKNGSNGQRDQNPGGDAGTPLQILPSWWSPETEKQLEIAAAVVASGPVPCEIFENGAYEGVEYEAQQPSMPEMENGQQPMVDNGKIDADNGVNVDVSNADSQFSVIPQNQSETAWPTFSSDHGFNGEPTSKLAASSPVSSPGIVVSPDELKTRVRHQVEYYFSRHNLVGDSYLLSQMDSEQYVNIITVSNFNMIKKLTTDLDLIVAAIRESPYLQLNETSDKVRPAHKRCTLVLRDIPEGTKTEEVEQLFSGTQCPKVVNTEIALNNIWYVNFETDEDAHKAFLYLRQKVRCFKGNPIMARIKTAPIPRVQQNGSHLLPPNTLPVHNWHYPALSPSPDDPGQFMISSDSSAFVNGPFSIDNDPICDTMAPVEHTNIMGGAMSVSTPMYYCPSGYLQQVWSPTEQAGFDLGYILAVNGFRAESAYRPALLVPSAPVSSAWRGQQFPRYSSSYRKPRGGGVGWSSSRTTNRTGYRNGDQAGERRDRNGAWTSDGHQQDRRGSTYGHYDSSGRRPYRGYRPNSRNYPNDIRPRGKRPEKFGESGVGNDDYQPHFSGKSMTEQSVASNRQKRTENNFSLHSSAFPPLPTVAVTADVSDAKASAFSNDPVEHREEKSIPFTASPVAKVHPRVKTPPNMDGIEMKVIQQACEIGDQHVSVPVATVKPLIPVAVVQPNTQQKSVKASTADKATVTDQTPPQTWTKVSSKVHSEEDSKFSMTGITSKLSYAAMAKLAAGRNAISKTTIDQQTMEKYSSTKDNEHSSHNPVWTNYASN